MGNCVRQSRTATLLPPSTAGKTSGDGGCSIPSQLCRISVTISPQRYKKNLDDLLVDFSGFSTIYLLPGSYEWTRQFEVKSPLRLIGISDTSCDGKWVEIRQTNPRANGFVIRKPNVIVRNLSISLDQGSGIAITVSDDASFVELSNLIIRGSDTTFSVYFSGPDVKTTKELQAKWDSSELPSNNVLSNCSVYSQFTGDVVAIALQRFATIDGNVIRGGRLAPYMLQDSSVCHNTVSDSSSSGIFLSLPSVRVRVIGNHITHSTHTGISVKPQLEHKEFCFDADHQIVLQNNRIVESRAHGMELNDVRQATITENSIFRCLTGIYLLRCRSVAVSEQTIWGATKKCVLVDNDCCSIDIFHNSFQSEFPLLAENFIWSKSTATSCHLLRNAFIGRAVGGDVSLSTSLWDVRDNVKSNKSHIILVE